MYIVHELYRNEQSFFATLSLGEHGSQHKTGTGSFRQLLHNIHLSHDPKKVLLLDETRFSWFATPIAFCAVKPCTTQDMYECIDPIIHKYGGHHTEKLFYHIDAITVNNQPTDYYIGQVGEIRCVLHVIALQRDDWYIAKSVFGKDIEQIHIYPSSFFTLHHIKQTLHKQHGTMIYIGQYYTKRIVFVDGIYKTCEMLDLGREVLKDIYKENNIRDFFDASKTSVQENTYAKGLVEQSVRFYVDMLLRWLRSYNTTGDIFLVSDIIHNEFFMDIFSAAYQQISQSFIIPISHIQGLKTYGKNWGIEEIDTQTAAHYIV